LSWTDNADNEAGFKVERLINGGWQQIGQDLGPDVIQFIDSGLAENTLYTYRVAAFNSAGLAVSNTDSATTLVELTSPEAPTGLTASAVSTSRIDLSWSDNSDNEQGFIIESSADGSTGWTAIATVATDATSYADSGLDADSTHFYRVYSYNSVGNSTYSNIADATTDALPLFVDNNVVQEVNIDGTVTGSFEDTYTSSGNTARQSIQEVTLNGSPRKRFSYLEHKWIFQVEPGAAVTLFANTWASVLPENEMFVFSYSTDDITYTDMFMVTGDSDNDTYYMHNLPDNLSGTLYVRVVDTNRTPGVYNENFIYIDELFVRVHTEPGTPPDAPSALAGTALFYDTVELNWLDNSDNEMGFFIERSPDGINNWEYIGITGPDTTVFTDTGLSPNKTYFYQVSAFNASGSSDSSGIAETTTLQADALHIGDYGTSSQPNRNFWDAAVTLTVMDQDGNTVGGATVSGSWDTGETANCVTDSSGQCTVSNTKLKISNVSSTTFTVTELSKSGYVYDAQSNITSAIEVLRP
ncbi:MAG: fibronectin type III domain-containing protein, partial [Desulfobulbales bacterium]|nr:fibronectin type III domain-containing protein [Desulfobulbales bacterium]